jgi:hypothetical protein
MPALEVDGVFYSKDVPRIWFDPDDEVFHVSHKIGGFHAEFIFRPRRFIKAVRDAEKAIDAFHDAKARGHGNVHKLGNEKH